MGAMNAVTTISIMILVVLCYLEAQFGVSLSLCFINEPFLKG